MRKRQAYYQMEKKSLWANQKQQNELVHLQASFSFCIEHKLGAKRGGLHVAFEPWTEGNMNLRDIEVT